MVWIPGSGIWAARHETTQQQYQRVMNANPSAFRGPQRPVDSVTWYDAVRYCETLTEKERAAGALTSSLAYRLPKDTEWSSFAQGAEISQAVHGRPRGQGTNDVGSRGGNRYGLYDILGNVWEWCLDDYSPSMDSAAVRAQLPELSSGGKVLRGGSWSTSASSVMLRVDTHGSDRAGEVSNTNGFRVVLAPER
jgi:formylglycine-generating enzyme required for sulfatase activity